MCKENINPQDGLPQELFLLATTLMPCPNVDLFITDDNNRLLLTWRDDEYYGKGWHIPGGCLRLGETFETRIQKTAKTEIGTEVQVNLKDFYTKELIIADERESLENQLERSHNISMLFHCKIPNGFIVYNNGRHEHTRGFAKWFEEIPSDILPVHKKIYGGIMNSYFKGELEWKM